MGSYWEIAVESSLGEHGIAATDEQIKAIAEDMRMAREMEHECSAPVSHPALDEVRQLKASIKAQEDEHRRNLAAVEQLALRARGLNDVPHERSVDVHIRDGRAGFVERR